MPMRRALQSAVGRPAFEFSPKRSEASLCVPCVRPGSLQNTGVVADTFLDPLQVVLLFLALMGLTNFMWVTSVAPRYHKHP